jgi:hypothetical protein
MAYPKRESREHVATCRCATDAEEASLAGLVSNVGEHPHCDMKHAFDLLDHLGSTDMVLDAAGGAVTVAEGFTTLGARRRWPS